MSLDSKTGLITGTPSLMRITRVAFPLVLAFSGHAFRLFADRVMLSRYDPDALAASMPASLACFCLMSIFIGTAGYANSFVAQYSGAGHEKKTGIAVWQALYIALVGSIVVACASLLAVPLFRLTGHDPEVQVQEVKYFTVLARLSFGGIGLAAVNTFWSGRGKTGVIMLIELTAAGTNIILNNCLIYGRWGFPEMGIAGAGIATGTSNLVGLSLGLALFLSPANGRRYGTFPRRTFEPEVMRRMLRFGFPNGLQFMLDLFAFQTFITIMGRTGREYLEAGNIAFGINALAFLPIQGIGTAASIFVGQGIGARNIAYARNAVRKVVLLGVFYTVAVGIPLVLLPNTIVSVFIEPGDSARLPTMQIATRCLSYIALYLLADCIFCIYSHSIKGAGDTRFAMIAGVGLAWGTLILPCVIALELGGGPWSLWGIVVAHVFLLAVVYYSRYQWGPWPRMRVIELVPPPPPEVEHEAQIGM